MVNVAELRVRKVPEVIYRQLKVWCAQEGVTLNALIVEILAKAVDNRPKGK